MGNPNDVYAVLAAINGTMLAIVGGFLLTWGLQHRGEIRAYLQQELEDTRAISAWAKAGNAEMEEWQRVLDTLEPFPHPPRVDGGYLLDEVFAARQARKANAEDLRARISAKKVEIRQSADELLARNERSRRVLDAWRADYQFAFGGLLLLVILCSTGVLLPLWLIVEPTWAPSFLSPGWLLKVQAVLFVIFGVFLHKVLFANILDTEKGDSAALLPELVRAPADEHGRDLEETRKAILYVGLAALSADLLIVGPEWLDRTLLAVWRSCIVVVLILSPFILWKRHRLLVQLEAYPSQGQSADTRGTPPSGEPERAAP